MVVLITVMNKKGQGRTKWIGKPAEVLPAIIGTAVTFIQETHKDHSLPSCSWSCCSLFTAGDGGALVGRQHKVSQAIPDTTA